MSARNLERHVDRLCATGEKIMFRILIFGCFALEVGRLVRWLLRG
jgi:hypothetical protein